MRQGAGVRRWSGLALSFVWLAGLAWGGRGLVTQRDAMGLTDQVLALASALPADSVLLFDDAAPVGLGDFLGTPLQFLGGHHAFTVRDKAWLKSADLEPLFRNTVTGWQRDGHTVYWIGDPEQARSLGLRTRAGPVVELGADVLEGTTAGRPRAIVRREWLLRLSEIVLP